MLDTGRTMNSEPRSNTRSASTTVSTGSHSPVSGWWAPLNAEGATRYVQQGSMMPCYAGEPARWRLAHKSLPVAAVDPGKPCSSSAVDSP